MWKFWRETQLSYWHRYQNFKRKNTVLIKMAVLQCAHEQKHIHTHKIFSSLQAALYAFMSFKLKKREIPPNFGLKTLEKCKTVRLSLFLSFFLSRKTSSSRYLSLGWHTDVQLGCTRSQRERKRKRELEKRWHSPECFIFSGIGGTFSSVESITLSQ